MLKVKKYILTKPFDGFPDETGYQIVEEDLPPIKDGEFLAKALYIKLCPVKIKYYPTEPEKPNFVSLQIAKIVKSKNNDFQVDEYVEGSYGWHTYTIANGTEMINKPPNPLTTALPDLPRLGIPVSYSLSVLGIPGLTAYSTLLDFCHPKSGDTVVITTAQTPIGIIAGQIAKIKGCRVIGVVKSEQAGIWIVKEYKFDHFVNTNKANFKECLIECTPNKIDCFFDIIMDEHTTTTICERMNADGRKIRCERQGNYFNVTRLQTANTPVVTQTHGSKVFQDMKAWIEKKELKVPEIIMQGFDTLYDLCKETRNRKHIRETVIVEV